jgi:hypothetical protein
MTAAAEFAPLGLRKARRDGALTNHPMGVRMAAGAPQMIRIGAPIAVETHDGRAARERIAPTRGYELEEMT